MNEEIKTPCCEAELSEKIEDIKSYYKCQKCGRGWGWIQVY